MKTKRGHPRLDALAFFLQRCSGLLLRCRCGPPRRTARGYLVPPVRRPAPRAPLGLSRLVPACIVALSGLLQTCPGTPPPKAPKQKIGSQCNFFAIRDCLEIPDCGLRRKNPGNLLYCGPISLFGNGKEPAIAKKLQKCRDFCFCSGLIAETRRIPREEHGVLSVKAAARHYRCY